MNSLSIRAMSTSVRSLQPVKILTGSNDHHGGIIVDMKEPMDASVFVSLLRASIAVWRQQVIAPKPFQLL